MLLPTPAKSRRIRVSISPKKKTPAKPRPSDPYPARPKLIPPPSPSSIDDCDLDLNFTFWDEEKSCFKPIGTAELDTLVNTLVARYPQAESVFVTVPFCVVECGADIPAESEQCFLAAGLVVVFHRIGEPYPFGVDFIGIRGSNKAPSIPSDVENDLRPCHIPALSTLEYIFNMIPEASHISSYPFQLVFEIVPMDVSSFNALVETLLERMGSLNIGYVNGALLVKRHAGVIRQDPSKIEGTIDTTNYLLAKN